MLIINTLSSNIRETIWGSRSIWGQVQASILLFSVYQNSVDAKKKEWVSNSGKLLNSFRHVKKQNTKKKFAFQTRSIRSKSLFLWEELFLSCFNEIPPPRLFNMESTTFLFHFQTVLKADFWDYLQIKKLQLFWLDRVAICSAF